MGFVMAKQDLSFHPKWPVEKHEEASSAATRKSIVDLISPKMSPQDTELGFSQLILILSVEL